MPHTNSHREVLTTTAAPVHELVEVVADPSSAVLGAAALVVGVAAARRQKAQRHGLGPLSADAQARVDAGGSSLVERRWALRTHNW